jgi:hypothetical protein
MKLYGMVIILAITCSQCTTTVYKAHFVRQKINLPKQVSSPPPTFKKTSCHDRVYFSLDKENAKIYLLYRKRLKKEIKDLRYIIKINNFYADKDIKKLQELNKKNGGEK